MSNTHIKSVDLINYYINKIIELDQNNIKYNSVYKINSHAISYAKALDQENKLRSKIHGMPVLIKDNINTFDMTTTAGTTILKDFIPNEDATLVKTLRDYGAIILGKTNLTELACFKTFTGVNGYSSQGGQVLCPWDIKADPSGSSTGSAVAISLGLAPFAIGTETGGSIMSPSMRNGIVGLKPTIGLVPRTGILPISHTLDTAGPMAKKVSDVALLLSYMRSNDPMDPITLNKEDKFVDYTTFLNTSQVKRIGIVKTSAYPTSDDQEDMFDKVCKDLSTLGYELIDVVVPEVEKIYPIMKYEFKHDLNSYLKKEGLSIELKDIVYYNLDHSEENLKYGQDVLIEALEETSGLLNEEAYLEALDERDEIKAKVAQLFEDKQIDMLYFINYTSIGPECGFPTLTVPVGFGKNHMPLGTYFLAPYYKEGNLIEVAHKLENHLNIDFDPLKK